MSVGVAIGVAIGAAFMVSMGPGGMIVGIAIGIAIGAAMKERGDVVNHDSDA